MFISLAELLLSAACISGFRVYVYKELAYCLFSATAFKSRGKACDFLKQCVCGLYFLISFLKVH